MAGPIGPTLVLLVDDDGDCRHIYSLALEHAGHKVITANDGAEGIKLAKEHEPHVILMDIAMPVMDGYTALKQLRSHPATKDLPILALTARASAHEVGELLKAGFDELLLKPVAPIEVVAAVNQRVANVPHESSIAPTSHRLLR